MATGQSSPTRHLRRSRAMTETCSARTVMLLQKLDTVCASPVKWTRVTDRPGRRVPGLPGTATPTEPSVRISRTGLFDQRFTE